MKLNKLALEDRSFLIQFDEIFKEFGGHIPWLDKIKNVRYLTDTDVFSSQLLENLGLNSDVEINPYILTNDAKGKEYVGSILNFSSSPEHFSDPNNEVIRQQLESEKYAYITCLQIRDIFRSERYGTELVSKAIEQIIKKYDKFWGVVSDPRLLVYYRRFGIEALNTTSNKDSLYLVSCDGKMFTKRH